MAERRGLRSEVRYQRSERRQDAIRSSKIAQRFSAGECRKSESLVPAGRKSSFVLTGLDEGGRDCPSAKALGYDQGKSSYALEPRRTIEPANSSHVTYRWSFFLGSSRF